MCEVHLSARCHPTEDRERVAGALKAFFPDAIVEGDDVLYAQSRSVEAFAEQLAKQRIRAAARKMLLRNVVGDEVHFRLSKQVATTGKISLSEEDHALGDIEVTIRSADIEAVVDRIAPRPRQGDAA
ncbi:MAG: hypothetical protein JSV90_02535 [Methanobacteriota archaeon]|nr:MAG: hypothetical protein JSV90_02535 [Euryarchaeota archaeon]